MFYNLENLYDTSNDPNKDDDDFTPSGNRRWTQIKYQRKLENLGEVFQAVSSLPGGFPAIVGVSEIENDSVLEDMVSQKRLSGAGYRFVHFESNDSRGVDVALLYRSSRFKLLDSQPLKPILRSGREYFGRDILVVRGLLDGEMFAFYVCHFLSRRGGRSASAGFRRAGAETIYYHALQMRDEFPGIKIIVMGDMNDTPADFSLSHLLHAVADMEDVEEGGFFNPMWTLMEEGQGTSLYNHHWTLFDN
ncbi:MAG: endonuclease/exonuclease/phosphatase family protein, partial [Bacteroidales bacterium]|nr:endonuclease/exonuclease/phosphatase family protein [Bacteroidales bacterium]